MKERASVRVDRHPVGTRKLLTSRLNEHIVLFATVDHELPEKIAYIAEEPAMPRRYESFLRVIPVGWPTSGQSSPRAELEANSRPPQ